MIGETIAQYKILEQLGEGGMGVVYKARDTRLERDVALKFLKPELIRTDKDKKRFFREARVLAALDHTNICAVYDLNEADGRAYIAMPLLKGKDLRSIIDEGPMPIDKALEIFKQVVLGIQAAHENDVIHRDIKSTNIIMTPKGDAKILDFGLARLSDRTMLTTEGTTMGTILYMSPEQSTGDVVDHRTDIWALGVLLYELVTGTFPFKADFDQAIIYLILNETPKPLSDHRDDIPTGVQEIIDIALEKGVEDRFQSATELLEAIDNVLAGVTPTKRPKAPPAGPTQPTVEIDPNTVAVFDFTNASANPDDDWLSGGIAETLTTDLKRIASLRLVPRNQVIMASAAQVEGEITDEQVVNVGKAIGAHWGLWGSYQKFGDSIRITANVSRTPTGELVDSHSADGPMRDMLKIQTQIVTRFTEIIDVRPTTDERKKIEKEETGDEKAYELYARARQRSNQMGTQGFEETEQLYKKAIELDPEYALAYSGLSSLHLWRYIAQTDPADLDAGEDYAKKAVEIDDELGEPYLWLMYASSRRDNIKEAAKMGRKAIALEDNNAPALYFLGGVIFALEPTKDTARESIELARRSVKHSPRFQPAYMELGGFYQKYGQYDSAIPEFEKAAAIEEAQRGGIHPFVGGITRVGDVLFSLRRLDAARLTYQKALAAMELSTHVYRDGYIASSHCGLGDVEFASDNYAEALKHYGKAHDIVNAHSERLGIGHVFVRACAGMSKSFHGLGVNREAAQKLREGVGEFHNRKRFDFGIGIGADDSTYYYLASAYAELQQTDEALGCLEKAFELGWGELPQLDLDENLSPLQDDDRISQYVTALREADPLT